MQDFNLHELRVKRVLRGIVIDRLVIPVLNRISLLPELRAKRVLSPEHDEAQSIINVSKTRCYGKKGI